MVHLDKRSQSAARRPFIDELTVFDDSHAPDCDCDDCIYNTVRDPGADHPLNCRCRKYHS